MSLEQKNKELSCKGSDCPYTERVIHFTKIVLFAAEVSLKQFVSNLLPCIIKSVIFAYI